MGERTREENCLSCYRRYVSVNICPASEHTDCIRGYIGSLTFSSSISSSSSSSTSSSTPSSSTSSSSRRDGGVTATATTTLKKDEKKEEEEVAAGGSCLWTAHYVPHYARTQGALSARARPGNLVRHSSRRRFFPFPSSPVLPRLRCSRIFPCRRIVRPASSICLVRREKNALNVDTSLRALFQEVMQGAALSTVSRYRNYDG